MVGPIDLRRTAHVPMMMPRQRRWGVFLSPARREYPYSQKEGIALPDIVDIDHQDSWPAAISGWVHARASQLKGTTEYTSDLAVPAEEEESFRRLFAGHLLRAYHCTRLLEHEVPMIRTQGLRMTTEELVVERITQARAHGAISDEVAETLLRHHLFAIKAAEHRDGQVCLILSRRAFDDAVPGVETLLGTWGGEIIYRGTSHRPELSQLGRPAIVVAHLDIAGGDRRHLIFTALSRVFVGAALDLPDAYADVFYRASVSAAHIEAIWQPGEPEYDCYPKLPQH